MKISTKIKNRIFVETMNYKFSVYIINSSPLVPFKSSPLVPLKRWPLDTLKNCILRFNILN